MSDSLDIENHAALLIYLRERGRIEADETPRMRDLGGGVSNRVVLVERENGESWVLKQALEKLRVAVDWFSDPRRIRHEALGLRWLEVLIPNAITPLVFEDEEHHLLAMRAVPQPHENWKTRLLRGEIEDDYVLQFARLLSRIHSRAREKRDALAPLFDDDSFFQSLRLEPYYEYSAAQTPAAAAFLRALINDTRARRHTLVHGDYSPKNILIYREQLVLLDHEVIHWGDGMFDIGFALAHLLGKAHHLKTHRAAFLKAAKLFYQEYCSMQEYSRTDETYAVRHTLGCCLARAVGRSPLEYLDENERHRQSEIIVAMMKNEPPKVVELIDEFGERLAWHESKN